MRKSLYACALLTGVCVALAWSTLAWSAPADPPPVSAWRDVMRAQYAARQAPLPMRPEEAQRIYDAYLRQTGQESKDNSRDTGANAGMTSR